MALRARHGRAARPRPSHCSTSWHRSPARGPSRTRSGRSTTSQLEIDAVGSVRRRLMQSVHPDESDARDGERVSQKVSALGTELSLNRGVYDAISGLDVSARRRRDAVLRARGTLRDFRLAGVDKDEATRKRIQALRDELTRARPGLRPQHPDRPAQRSKTDAARARGSARDYIARHKPDANGTDHAHDRLSRLAAGLLIRAERGPPQADVHGIQQPRVSRRTSRCSTR